MDLLVASSPPLFVGIAGTVISKKSIPMILDLRDIWPESAKALGEIKSPIILFIARWFEKKIYKHTKGCFLAVPGFSKYLFKRFPFMKDKIITNLMNGVSDSFIKEVASNNTGIHKEFIVLYSGNIGLAQGLETVIKTAQILKKYPIVFQIIGDGVERSKMERLKKEFGLINVVFIDPIPRKKLILFIKSASICLVPLKNNPLFLNAIPSKLLEYMSCGKPVLVGIKGEVEELVNKSNAGMCIEPQDEHKLAEGVLTYFNDVQLRKQHSFNRADYIRNNFMKEKLF